jgi:mercuric reductase
LFGIDVHLGSAQFIDAKTIEIGGKQVKFNKAVVATGGKPRIPQIPGLD